MFTKLREFFGVKEVSTETKEKLVGDEPTADLWNQVDKVIQEVNNLHTETMSALEEEPKKTKKTKKIIKKFKVEYYSSTPDLERHYNDKASYFKVTHRTEKGLSTVNVSYLNEGINPHKAARVSGDGDLNLTITAGTKKLVLRAHEAHDLALALLKYHELQGSATFAKVKKSEVEKKIGKP